MYIRKIICLLGFFLFIFKKKEMDFSRINRIAILKSGAIGDILMTTPFLRTLRRGFPQAIIDFHLGKWSAEALQNNSNLNNIFTYDDSVFHSWNMKQKIWLTRNLRKQKYDLLFILDKSYLANLLGFATGIRFRIGFDRYGEGFPNNLNIKYGPVRHEIDYYLDLAKIIGINSNNKSIELNVSKEDNQHINELTHTIKNYIGIIPGGAKNPGGGVVDSRRWPIEKFIELIKVLKRQYLILLLGGKSDVELNNKIIAKIGNHNILNFAGKTSISQSCELMRRCKYIICSDSGPMHIASASGIKVISLFGPTNPARKAPLGKSCIALWKDEKVYHNNTEIYGFESKRKEYFQQLSVQDVLDSVKRLSK